ncbi:MAG: hypothetical protein E7640_04285 [Ruminococcaceae bacterium]|nr:hypothetical protein [Oscillospiraceae bacterium]
MKKRLICLFLCILMIVPVCLMAGCADKTSEDAKDDMVDKASEATVTVTMYLMSEQHVYTAEELAKIKEEAGASSKTYEAAKAVHDAYEAVELAMNKITKAKFKTQVNVYWYTEDEYYDVIEKKLTGYDAELKMKEEAQAVFEAFERKNSNITNRLELKALFDKEYPQYASYIVVVADDGETTEATAEQTMIGASGIPELKYPDEGKNQVDIIYMGGYDIYKEYASKKWLQDLSDEFTGNSKKLGSYINSAFFEAMELTVKAIDGEEISGKFALPTNEPIGEYVYMLIDKTLYEEYYYPIDEIDEITSIADIYDFIDDIGKSNAGITPFTGELITTGTHFWSTDYKFVSAGNISEFEEGRSYFTKNSENAYLLVGEYVNGVEYFTIDEETGHYIAHTKTGLGDDKYYTIDPAAYEKATKFVSGVTYYTVDEKGNYVVAEGIKNFANDVEYYKIKSENYAKVDKEKYSATEGVTYYTKKGSEYIKAEGLTSFGNGDYYIVRDADDEERPELRTMYVEYGAFDPTEEYYIANISIKPNEFSLVGSAISADADKETLLGFKNIFSEDLDYADQLLAIKKIQEKGYYDASAIANNKDFAVGIVRGGADLADKYGEKYAMVMLNAPTADFSKMYDHLFGVTTASANLERSMEIVTLLNTDSEFRNLVQYGILNENYTLKTVEINGKQYSQAEIKEGSYYQMDIYKTGNLFVAYPDTSMPADIWEYGKLQNSQSRVDVLSTFNLDALMTPDLVLLDKIEQLSKQYKAEIDACETADELERVLEELANEAEVDETIKALTNPSADDLRNLNNIYTEWHNETYPNNEK